MLELFESSFERYEKNVAVLTLQADGTIIDANEYYLRMFSTSEGDHASNNLDRNINNNIDSNKWYDHDSIDIIGKNIIEFDNELACNGLSIFHGSTYGHYHSSLVKVNKELIPIEVGFFYRTDQIGLITLCIKNLNFLNDVKCNLSFLSKIFKASKEGILITDALGLILSVNQSFRDITGYSNKEVLGKTPAILKSGKQNKHFYHKFWQTLISTGSWQGEIWNKRKNGEIFPEWLNISSLKGNNKEITHYICQFSDISIFKKSIEDKKTYTYYDPLTCLPNRALLFEKLAMLRKSCKAQSKCFSVLFCDLDRFKLIMKPMGTIFAMNC